MLAALLLTLNGWARFTLSLFIELRHTTWKRFLPRLSIFALVWVLGVLLTCWHWLGFLLDEIFFRSYRRVRIESPIFILGIPRSGTTWLQRGLAHDDHLSTLTLGEALFTPAISQRVLAKFLSPLIKLLKKGSRRLGSFCIERMDAIHKLGLGEPEEDFLLLLPIQACFLAVFLCPRSEYFWRLAKFDQSVAEREQRQILKFYRRCLQKHLHQTGCDKRILSKNPSLTSWMVALRTEFTDACIIACVRPPVETVSSQLSSVQPALELLNYDDSEKQRFRSKLIATLQHYYDYIEIEHRQNEIRLVSMQALRDDLEKTVTKLYSSFAIVLDSEFELHLSRLSEKAKNYRSDHHYDLSQFGLSDKEIESMFSASWQPLNSV